MKSFKVLMIAFFVFAVITGQVSAGSINKDLKISGEYELDYVYDDTSMEDEDDNEESFIEHELDLEFELGIAENVLVGGAMEYADSTLGEDDHALDKDNGIDVEEAYIEAKFQGVTFTGGKFGFDLPAAFDGSMILDVDSATGVDFDFGMVSVGMLRAKDYEGDKDIDDKTDIFYAMGEIKSGNMKFGPYVAVETRGENGDGNYDDATDDGYTSFWLGSAFEMETGFLVILGDFVYGTKSYSKDYTGKDQSGFFMDIAAEMDMGNMTPTAFLIYSSGNDDDADEHETIPTIATDYEPLNIFGDANGDIDFMNGLTGIGLGINDMNFAPKLKHDLVFFYARGNNDENSGQFFTEDDTAMEIDFNSVYEVMDDFEIYANLGYSSIDLDRDFDDEAGTYMEIGMEVNF